MLAKYNHKYPVKAYEFGTLWEIRDAINRTVIRFTFMSGDIYTKRKYTEVLKFIADKLNEEHDKEVKVESEVYADSIDKLINPLSEKFEKLEVVEKSKRGRPKKK